MHRNSHILALLHLSLSFGRVYLCPTLFPALHRLVEQCDHMVSLMIVHTPLILKVIFIHYKIIKATYSLSMNEINRLYMCEFYYQNTAVSKGVYTKIFASIIRTSTKKQRLWVSLESLGLPQIRNNLKLTEEGCVRSPNPRETLW